MKKSPTRSGWGRFRLWLLLPANIFLLVLTAIAILRVSWPNAATEKLKEFTDQDILVHGKLYDDPDLDGSLTKVRIRTEDGVQLFLTFKAPDAVLERGDTVTVQGKLKEGFGAFAGTIYRGSLVSYSKSSPPDRFLIIRN